MLLDAAHDAESIYLLLAHQGMEPFIDLNVRSKKNTASKGHPTIQISPTGIPICPNGNPMKPNGTDYKLESGRHRSTMMWYMRLYSIMTCQHMDAWYVSQKDDWDKLKAVICPSVA